MKNINSYYLILLCCLVSCINDSETALTQSDRQPTIFPDYTETTIPATMAPLNFRVEDATAVKAVVTDTAQKELLTVTGKQNIQFPAEDWNQLLHEQQGKSIQIHLSVWNKERPKGVAHKHFNIHISTDVIDPWIVYRLIDPGYVNWNQMGIYERELSSFTEKALINNREERNQCMNCHTSCWNSPDTYLYHKRAVGAGTVVYKNGKRHAVQLNQLGEKKQGVYPAWHPQGKYVVFSSNKTHQSFLHDGKKALEVFDMGSDLMIYDTESKEVLYDKRFNTQDEWESFPAFSPDGKYLYFCTTKGISDMSQLTNLKYALVKVAFDETNGTFGECVDTLYQPRVRGGSISHPRISPDGRFLLYTEAAYGTFPIWHNEADLRMMDLQSGKEVDVTALNSMESESFHSWSSNGRWILFVSRRMDGRHSRLYIAHCDSTGKVDKPFMLPQVDPEEHTLRLQSFNVPEFASGKIVK